MGGQAIFVIPKLDMVVVFTGAFGGEDCLNAILPPMVETYIIPAVKSDKPLSPNVKIVDKMQKMLREIETPVSQPVTPLPETAAKLSEKVFQCVPIITNELHYQSFSLRFDSKNACFLKIAWDNGNTLECPVGLDGVYRTSISKDSGPMAFKGSWVNNHEFVLNWQELRLPERIDQCFSFDGDEVYVEISGEVTGFYTKIKGE